MPIDNITPGDKTSGMNSVKSPRFLRALGSLFGAAVGDALGATREFSYPANQPAFPDLATERTTMIGGGTFKVAPGQVTDDTQMALALARSIETTKGEFDAFTVIDEYAYWSGHAFDRGIQTSKALARISKNVYPGYAMYAEGSRSGAGNGTLMRATPIAVAFHDDPQNLLSWALHDALLTHGHPLAVLANVAYTAAIAFGINGGKREDATQLAYDALDVAKEALLKGNLPYTQEALDEACAQLKEDLDLSLETDPHLFSGKLKYKTMPTLPDAKTMMSPDFDWDAFLGKGPAADEAPREPDIWGTKGFVRTAFRYAFWHLNIGSTYAEAVIDASSRGGDADTNAAIIGGLLGAFEGRDAIPEEWLTKVTECQPGGIWDDYYHPNFFNEFAYRAVY